MSVVIKLLLVENCTKMLKMAEMLFEGMRKHRIEDPLNLRAVRWEYLSHLSVV